MCIQGAINSQKWKQLSQFGQLGNAQRDDNFRAMCWTDGASK
jgi:hypothetical protein